MYAGSTRPAAVRRSTSARKGAATASAIVLIPSSPNALSLMKIDAAPPPIKAMAPLDEIPVPDASMTSKGASDAATASAPASPASGLFA